jgi:membrane protein YqaA with SNARE-associated domain
MIKAAQNTAIHRKSLLDWLISLGGLGLFAVAIVDSSVIPLAIPGSTDLLLLLLSAHRRTTILMAIWLVSCALAGSLVGGYLTWSVGRKGGKSALERHIPQRLLGRVSSSVEKYGIWSVALATLLPPPIPLTPFVLASGALGMELAPFLVSYGLARAVRYSLLAWLGVTYGRHIVTVWQKELNGWSTPILWTYFGLLVLGFGYGLWKMRQHSRQRTTNTASAGDSE